MPLSKSLSLTNQINSPKLSQIDKVKVEAIWCTAISICLNPVTVVNLIEDDKGVEPADYKLPNAKGYSTRGKLYAFYVCTEWSADMLLT